MINIMALLELYENTKDIVHKISNYENCWRCNNDRKKKTQDWDFRDYAELYDKTYQILWKLNQIM